MSQAVAALSRNLIPLLVCITLAACNGSYTAFESDQNFDTDQKTADIEQDNAELMALAAYQSAFLGHYQSAAYDFLDVTDLPLDVIDLPENLADLPIDVVPTSIEKKYRLCSDGGTALYGYSRNADEAHKVGDRISVRYQNCTEGDSVYNGSMTGTYSKIKGLNDRFENIGTYQCLPKLEEKLSMSNSFFDLLTYDPDNNYFIRNDGLIIYMGSGLNLKTFDGSGIISLPGDEIRFFRENDYLVAELVSNYTFINSGGEEETESYIVLKIDMSKESKIIFILRPKNPIEGMVTSVDGDQIYSVQGLESQKENCQNFERTISVHFDKFSTEKTDYLKTSLNGNVTLLDSQQSANRYNRSLVNSNFTTTVTQGFTTEVYSMKDYSVEQAVNKTDGTYSYEFNGFVSNANLLKGKVSLTTFGRLMGDFGSTYPRAGTLEMKAKGLERIVLNPDNLKITLQVDYNGDSTGNGFGDFDIFINTTWPELFSREFKE